MDKKKVNKKLKVRRIIIVAIIVIVAILLLTGVFKIFGSIFSKEENVGNLNNRGLAVENKNETFYNKYEKGIYKVKGSKEYKLTDETAYSMTYYKDKIYYLTVSSSNSIDLKSVDTNGKEVNFISTLYTRISKFYIEDGFVYYITNKDVVGISKLELETGRESVIITASVQDFVVDNKTIYYTDNVGFLYSINIDGTNNVDITRDYSINQIQILDKWIYYYNGTSMDGKTTNGLYKIKKDGTNNTLVCDKISNEYYNVTSKGIFYYDDVNKKIVKTDLKGKKQTDIVSLDSQMSLTRINIANDTVYYLDKSNDNSQIYQMFRAKTNGKKEKSIEY